MDSRNVDRTTTPWTEPGPERADQGFVGLGELGHVGAFTWWPTPRVSETRDLEAAGGKHPARRWGTCRTPGESAARALADELLASQRLVARKRSPTVLSAEARPVPLGSGLAPPQ